MSKSKNVWSKYADKPAYIVPRERVRTRDKRAAQKREVRVLLTSILKYSDESGDDNE